MAQAIPLALMAAGTAVSAAGTLGAASSQAHELRGEAVQLDQQAGQDRASSQRTAAEQKRQSKLLQSRALAVAGASGGGVSDPTVVNQLAALEGEGELRMLTALYEGEEQARSAEMQAKARRREAKNVKKAALFNAAGQVLQAGATMYGKYG